MKQLKGNPDAVHLIWARDQAKLAKDCQGLIALIPARSN